MALKNHTPDGHKKYLGILNSMKQLFSYLKQIISALTPSGGGGLATEAKQDDVITALAGIDTINSSISVDVDDLERAVWDSVPGQSTSFTYYAGVEAGNPSGNKNVKTIQHLGSTEPARPNFTQTFTYDADDDVLTITAS